MDAVQKEEIGKKGRTLSIISFGIVIYLLGDASLTDEFNFLGGGIKFKDQRVLEIGAIIIFIYSFFRFRMANAEPIKNFINEYHNRLRSDSKIRRYINEIATEELKKVINGEDEVFGRAWNGNESNYPIEAIWAIPRNQKPIKIKKLKSTTSAIARSNSRQKVGEFEIKIGNFRHLNTAFRMWIKTLWDDDTFWIQLLPVMLGLTAAVLLLCDMIL